MSRDAILRAPSKVLRRVIDRTNYVLLRRLPTAREVSPGQVSKLVDLLKAGKHFLTPLAVNDVSNGTHKAFVIIDGGHRMAAIGKLIDQEPSFRIEVEFHVFDHLTDGEARAVFDAWNEGLRQTMMSRLWVNQKDYPIIGLIHKDFPVEVSFEQSTRKGPHFRATPLVIGIGSWGKGYTVSGGKQFYSMVAGIEDSDHALAKQFAEDFVAAFGEPTHTLPFIRTPALIAALRVWRANVDPPVHEGEGTKIGREEVRRRWKQRVSENPWVRQQLLVYRGTGGSDECEKVLVTAMNKGEGRLLSVVPGDIWKARQKNGTPPKHRLSAAEWAKYHPLIEKAYASVRQTLGISVAKSNVRIYKRFLTMFPEEAAVLLKRTTETGVLSQISRWRNGKWKPATEA
jgi:hypothetical protein